MALCPKEKEGAGRKMRLVRMHGRAEPPVRHNDPKEREAGIRPKIDFRKRCGL